MPDPRDAAAALLAGAALVGAVLAGAALGPSTSPAAVEAGSVHGGGRGPGAIAVAPRVVQQDGTLTITVAGASCRGTGRPYDAIVESNAFPRAQLRGLPGKDLSIANPRIFSAAEPGTYSVTATCGGRTVTAGHFRVVVSPHRAALGGRGGSHDTDTGGAAIGPD